MYFSFLFWVSFARFIYRYVYFIIGNDEVYVAIYMKMILEV